MRQHYPVFLPFLALENLVLKCYAVSIESEIACIKVHNAARLSPCIVPDKYMVILLWKPTLLHPPSAFLSAFLLPKTAADRKKFRLLRLWGKIQRIVETDTSSSALSLSVFFVL